MDLFGKTKVFLHELFLNSDSAAVVQLFFCIAIDTDKGMFRTRGEDTLQDITYVSVFCQTVLLPSLLYSEGSAGSGDSSFMTDDFPLPLVPMISWLVFSGV